MYTECVNTVNTLRIFFKALSAYQYHEQFSGAFTSIFALILYTLSIESHEGQFCANVANSKENISLVGLFVFGFFNEKRFQPHDLGLHLGDLPFKLDIFLLEKSGSDSDFVLFGSSGVSRSFRRFVVFLATFPISRILHIVSPPLSTKSVYCDRCFISVV